MSYSQSEPGDTTRHTQPTDKPHRGVFAGPVWANSSYLPYTDAYTIRAVGQEEFSDVKVPDAPAQTESQKK